MRSQRDIQLPIKDIKHSIRLVIIISIMIIGGKMKDLDRIDLTLDTHQHLHHPSKILYHLVLCMPQANIEHINTNCQENDSMISILFLRLIELAL